jgi:hypothetical protein
MKRLFVLLLGLLGLWHQYLLLYQVFLLGRFFPEDLLGPFALLGL